MSLHDQMTKLLEHGATKEEHEAQNETHAEALNKTGFWGKEAAGCMVLALSTGRFLIPHRGPKGLTEPNTWGTWGGAIDEGEDPIEAVERELKEESGYAGKVVGVNKLHVFEKPDFKYHNHIIIIPDEFVPKLNWETSGYRWCKWDDWPKPLHFGLKAILDNANDVRIIKGWLSKCKSEESKVEASVYTRLRELC